jgi:nitrite reductase (NADH) small subunit
MTRRERDEVLDGLRALVAGNLEGADLRVRHARRLQDLRRRYGCMHFLTEASSSEEAARALLYLLTAHPTAFREWRCAGPRQIASRSAESELLAQAGSTSDLQKGLTAIADTSWMLREIRWLRRVTRQKQSGARALEHYRTIVRQESLRMEHPQFLDEIARTESTRYQEWVSAQVFDFHGVASERALWLGAFGGEPGPGCVYTWVPWSALPQDGCGVHVLAFGQDLAVFRVLDRYFAVERACPHRQAPLERGEVEAGVVQCPLHGYAFDLESGERRDGPGSCIRTYPVRTGRTGIFIGARQFARRSAEERSVSR